MAGTPSLRSARCRPAGSLSWRIVTATMPSECLLTVHAASAACAAAPPDSGAGQHDRDRGDGCAQAPEALAAAPERPAARDHCFHRGGHMELVEARPDFADHVVVV